MLFLTDNRAVGVFSQLVAELCSRPGAATVTFAEKLSLFDPACLLLSTSVEPKLERKEQRLSCSKKSKLRERRRTGTWLKTIETFSNY